MALKVEAQDKKFFHQFGIVTENDSYSSINNDGYYTNGLKLNFQWRRKQGDTALSRKLQQVEIGQFLYNAEDGHYNFSKIDRPVTGYLYGTYRQRHFNRREDLLGWDVSFGLIGKPAFGEQVQNFIHRELELYETPQWPYQLKPGWGLTGSAIWSPRLLDPSRVRHFDIKPVAGAAVGNMFTHAMVGTALLLGRFNNNSSTAFWGNHAGSQKKNREFFVFFYPSLYLQAYNATVQGTMFKKEPEVIQGRLNPFFLQGRLGFLYSGNKFYFGYSLVAENKQSLTQRKGQHYGSIQLGYIW
ncbi:MAG: DUF2219 family protein [Rhodanobacter sp.]|nr:MAG: DUF2219 family protein [Rhodanobacter sp.]